MSRIEAYLNTLKSQGKKALVPFVTAGDPHPDWTVDILHALAKSGADIIEIGVPFSDPMADGPVIQLADERALAHGVTLKQILGMVKTFRQTNQDTPIVLMGYLNPVEVYGYEQFAKDAADAGVDGVLTVDLPPEAAAPLTQELEKVAIDPIFLLAPTSTEARIEKVAKFAKGYLYYVSLKGVTGAGNLDIAAVTEKLETIRKITDLPITVGFGIKDAESAAAVGAIAEGVVVGSAMVNIIAANQSDKPKLLSELSDFTALLKTAIE